MMVKRYVLLGSVMLLSSVVAREASMPLDKAARDPAVKAFLDVIAYVEGTWDEDGYRTLFGGGFFDGYTRHPRKEVCLQSRGDKICSSSAGRYQMDIDTWRRLAERIGAHDFSPRNQDRAMVLLLKDHGILTLLKKEKIAEAIKAYGKVRESFSKIVRNESAHTMNELLITFTLHKQKYNGTQIVQDPLQKLYALPSVKAFLDVIAYAEGTFDHGYRRRYPSIDIASLQKHPQTVLCAKSLGREICSSAAGRYQFLYRTWKALAWRISADNFYPLNQDRAAIVLLIDRNVIDDIKAQRFESALYKARAIWASLPHSPYNQPHKKLPALYQFYKKRLSAHKK